MYSLLVDGILFYKRDLSHSAFKFYSLFNSISHRASVRNVFNGFNCHFVDLFGVVYKFCCVKNQF